MAYEVSFEVLLTALTVSVIVITSFFDNPLVVQDEVKADFIVVFRAGLLGDIPSPRLQDRLDVASDLALVKDTAIR